MKMKYALDRNLRKTEFGHRPIFSILAHVSLPLLWQHELQCKEMARLWKNL